MHLRRRPLAGLALALTLAAAVGASRAGAAAHAAVATPLAPPRATAAPAAAIESYLRREIAARAIPGLGWAAIDGGRIVAEGYLGYSSVELKAPVDAGTVFAIASLDKQITTAGLLVLQQRGTLLLDDPLTRWLPGFDFGDVRLRQLVAHTSGLPDSTAPLMAGRSLMDYSAEDLDANVKSLAPLAPPGERYFYSDANLYLAQRVTEAAAKEPWRDFIRREVFAPAGMTTATFMDPLVLIPGRSQAYERDGAGHLQRDRRLEIDYGPLYDDLGMTVRDFARWLIALGTDRPLTRTSREAMWMPVRLADGLPNDESWQWRNYGLGVAVDRWNGRRVITHSGHSGVGFVYLPDEARGVVVFTNLAHHAGSDPIGLAWGILGRLWPDHELSTRPAASDPDPAGTAKLRGEWERQLAGTPQLELWAPRSRQAGWESIANLVGRSPRLGALESVAFVSQEKVGDELQRQLVATHENGTVLLRFALDGEGRIVALTWMHL